MSQQSLFFEGIEEAAEEIARHYPGGKKALAQRLRPNKSPTSAHTWFCDCANPARTEHNFAGEDWLALIKIGREIGCHAVMFMLCDEAFYERPRTVEPTDELAELQRQFVASVRQQAELVERIEKLGERGSAIPFGSIGGGARR